MTEELAAGEAAAPLPPRAFALLLILSWGPRHGYGLMQALKDGIAGERWVVGPATLYRTLKDLERRGWISGSAGPADESGGPPRRNYALTEAGRAVAAAEARRMERLVGLARLGSLVEGHRPG